MASSSTQSDATANSLVLTPVMTLEGHEPWNIPPPDGGHDEYKNVSCISYFPNGKQMISGSGDKTIRRWDLREGKEIEDAREVCENSILAVGISRDGRWVATAAGGELKVSEVKTGIVRTFHEGQWIYCIDISADSTLLVGGSWDTAWIWSLDTGKLVAGPLEGLRCGSDYPAGPPTLRLSENSRKLAVSTSLHQKQCLQVWDVQTQKLDVSRKSTGAIHGTFAPVFWTTKDKSIVTAFSFTDDRPKTIYEFDASTLKTIGAPFKGHATIRGLALSSDCLLLASTSYRAIQLWAFESRQLFASFDIQAPFTLVLSPDSRQLAYTTWDDTKICISNIPANILASIGLEEPQPSTSKSKCSRRAGVLNSDATRRRKPVIVPVIPPVPRLQRPSPTRDLYAILRFLRKLHPSSRTEPRDLLDFPATSPLPPSHINPHENSRSTPAPPAIQSSAISPSTTSKFHLHRLSTWWSLHAAPAIVDVPLAPGRLRHAAAGAPGEDDGLIRDEDYVSPPSPNPSSRQPPTAQTVNTGEHGSGRWCFCM